MTARGIGKEIVSRFLEEGSEISFEPRGNTRARHPRGRVRHKSLLYECRSGPSDASELAKKGRRAPCRLRRYGESGEHWPEERHCDGDDGETGNGGRRMSWADLFGDL